MEKGTYNDFKDTYMQTLEKHAPMKKKYVRGNNAPFMNKTLSKEFMHRAHLKNKFNKNPTGENKKLYTKQRNYCVSLLKKEKKKYYNNLDTKTLVDNRKFWERVKPIFTDKQKSLPNKITLIEDEGIICESKLVAEKLNCCFVEAVDKLGIKPYKHTENIDNIHESENEYQPKDKIEKIVFKYRNHPSILKIKENVKNQNKFSFSHKNADDFESAIMRLNPKKANSHDDIPTKILIKTCDIVAPHLMQYYNEAKCDQNFPCALKRLMFYLYIKRKIKL